MRRIGILLIILGIAIGLVAVVDGPGVSTLASSAAPRDDPGEPAQSTGRVAGAIRTTEGWSLEGRVVALVTGGAARVQVATATADAANQFVFEAVPAGDGYEVQLLGIDPGPLGPCSDPDPFSVRSGETTPVLVVCWR